MRGLYAGSGRACAWQLLLRKQRLRVADRNAEIRAAETLQNRYCNSDDFSIAIEERSAGAARSGLRIEHNFVWQDVANVPLRDQGMNQIAFGQLVQNLRHVAAAFL
jgi:phosphatidate phosphatase APP1